MDSSIVDQDYSSISTTHYSLQAHLTQHIKVIWQSIESDTDIPVTCWLSNWWDCSNIYVGIPCSWCIPDVKVIWYSIESQSGKALEIATVVVQCDGSQGYSFEEYEQ